MGENYSLIKLIISLNVKFCTSPMFYIISNCSNSFQGFAVDGKVPFCPKS